MAGSDDIQFIASESVEQNDNDIAPVTGIRKIGQQTYAVLRLPVQRRRQEVRESPTELIRADRSGDKEHSQERENQFAHGPS